ncbi:MAG: LysM peptidoglycan-binding domain-containing C40 family peptidase [Epsilonproteobacteria bacterium]|nr:LysM peptidoglycan-binding domain-containing C40 family peptidase [Campylobacterota bacterium]
MNKNSLKVLNTKSVRVEFGDSFSSFAKRHNLSIEELKKLNTEKFKGKLKYGDELLIPLSSETSLTSSKAKSSQKKDKNSDKREKKENFEVFKEKNKSKKVSEKTSSIIPTAKRKLGARYVYGAMGPYKFDCSGFTSYVFKTKGVCLPRKASAQYQRGEKVSRNNLKEGDLVFFDTDQKGYVNHSGIYLGNGEFIHSSSGKAYGVTVSNLISGWYKDKFLWGKRKAK